MYSDFLSCRIQKLMFSPSGRLRFAGFSSRVSRCLSLPAAYRGGEAKGHRRTVYIG